MTSLDASARVGSCRPTDTEPRAEALWPALTGPIAVGFDGSPQSRDALALGRELAGLTGERLVIAVVQPLNLPAIPDPTFIAGWKKRQALEAETLVDQAATIVGGNEGTDWWRCVVAALSPAQGLQYIVEHKEAGLVVLGHSHRQGAGVAVPGTTATRLLHGSPCAVAIAPPGLGEPHDRDHEGGRRRGRLR